MKVNIAPFFFLVSSFVLSATVQAMDNIPDFGLLYEAIDHQDIFALRDRARIYAGLINKSDVDGRTLLTYATNRKVEAEGEDLIVKCLVNEFKANVDVPDQDGFSPLFYAVLNKNDKLINYLGQKGATLSQMEKDKLKNKYAAPKVRFSQNPNPTPARNLFTFEEHQIALALEYSRIAVEAQEAERILEQDLEYSFAKHQSIIQPLIDAQRPRGKSEKIVKQECAYLCKVSKADSNNALKASPKNIKPKKKKRPNEKRQAIRCNNTVDELMQKCLLEYPSRNPDQLRQYFKGRQFLFNEEYRHLSEDEFHIAYTKAFELKFGIDIINEIKAIPGWNTSLSAYEIMSRYAERFPIDALNMNGEYMELTLTREDKTRIFHEKEISSLLEYIKYTMFRQ